MLRYLALNQMKSQGQFWLGVAASGTTHLLIASTICLFPFAASHGPTLVLEFPHGETATVAMVASSAFTASELIEPVTTISLPVPKAMPVLKRTTQAQPQSPLGASPKELIRLAAVGPPITLPRQQREPEEAIRLRPAKVPHRPTASAPQAHTITVIQDFGKQQPILPTKKTAPPFTYPLRALEAGIEGRVEVLVTINAAGNVTTAKLYRSSGHQVLDEAAIGWVTKWEFEVEAQWFQFKSHLTFRAPVRFDILPPM